MKINTIQLTLFVIALILSSCEGGTTFTKTIYNDSSEEIELTMYSYMVQTQHFTIKPKEAQQIYWNDEIGSFVDDSYTCTQSLDSVKITILSGNKLKKNIMDSTNWYASSKGGRNSREDCYFAFTDEDIE